MLDREKKKELYKQGYRFAGSHSAIKVCEWTKKSLRDEDVCYKEKFYDTICHRCVQMTPALQTCTHRCLWCWRDIEYTLSKWAGKVDDPKVIVDSCIKENAKYLEGFGGNKKTNFDKYKERLFPEQFAISLTGEPCMYPKLPELVIELRERGINSFLVTNGTNPLMLKKLLLKKAQPTQVYITLPAPDEKIYVRCCRPLIKNGWKKINSSLKLISKFRRGVFRLTLVKGLNMVDAEGYANLIKKYKPKFVECKAYMYVGYSQKRLKKENMPLHSEIKEFANRLAEFSGYKVIDEKENSRVVLLGRGCR
ncbi:MAG: 4-demethylwyosine synthase TYW1 [Nanoarchaeota archaeon]|nr:4-demethylwyosine synthase TYW1 [Nanoarchaeota archaeon]MBU1945334.1 4-demethylwyosine synthase TYW1 [Nanoarchaeota archaeon]